MRNVHPYTACFVEHVHLFPMNVMAVFLTLCVRDVRAALTMDFWIVLSVTALRVVMSVESFLVQN